MAERKVYIGNLGPDLFEDSNPLGDSDFPGSFRSALVTDGIIEAAGAIIAGEAIGDAAYSSLRVIAAGSATTTGGAVSEDFTISGVLASDVAVAVLSAVGAAPVTITTVAAGVDKITVTFSGDPSNDHTVSYIVVRS